ncbi:1-aminocyclopropane-1-carboxylate deaminase/D-cysteine desulfhydrase [Kerstersia similis]|uniref:1-aminocyclopropane-1-carboxylate deaminase/D-cysteine desulfhydrase n=1 Tax=Kerstersia similis TaxID=206505 RepID=UPI0039EFCB97
MTPLEKITYQGIQIHVKRDDLYPIAGGGNKGRKTQKIFSNIHATKNPVIITNGGLQSNHARVCALMAAKHKYECHLVLHSDAQDGNHICAQGNYLISKIAGASIHIVHADQIAKKIEEISSALIDANKTPVIIPGGGHCLEGSLAYVDAIKELPEEPDYIFLASGTGTTQAGLMAGLDLRQWNTKVIGISVARTAGRAKAVIHDSYMETRVHLGIQHPIEREVLFHDAWTFGGYEKHSPELSALIKDVAQQTGLILDPTYTAKAFFGMMSIIKNSSIFQYKKILFLHTGGLINLLTSNVQ